MANYKQSLNHTQTGHSNPTFVIEDERANGIYNTNLANGAIGANGTIGANGAIGANRT